jgi:hypothetical protein
VRVAEPVDRVVVAGAADQRVDEAVLLGVDELPDDADERQRQHHGEEEHALIDAAALDTAIDDDREQHAERGGDQDEDEQPDGVVLDCGPKVRCDLVVERLIVVLDAEEAARVRDAGQTARLARREEMHALDAAPLGERQRDGRERRKPNEPEIEQQGDTE